MLAIRVLDLMNYLNFFFRMSKEITSTGLGKKSRKHRF